MNVIIVVNPQNDSLIKIDGKNRGDSEQLLTSVVSRLETAAQNSEFIVPLIFSNNNEDPLFYKPNTEGWEVLSEIKKFSPITINHETAASIELARLIYSNNEVDSVELVGFDNDDIIANAITIKSFRPDVSIGVNLDCCRPFDASLSELLVSCGIELVGGETSNMEG